MYSSNASLRATSSFSKKSGIFQIFTWLLETDPVEEDNDDIVDLVKSLIHAMGVTEKYERTSQSGFKSFLLSAPRDPV